MESGEEHRDDHLNKTDAEVESEVIDGDLMLPSTSDNLPRTISVSSESSDHSEKESATDNIALAIENSPTYNRYGGVSVVECNLIEEVLESSENRLYSGNVDTTHELERIHQDIPVADVTLGLQAYIVEHGEVVIDDHHEPYVRKHRLRRFLFLILSIAIILLIVLFSILLRSKKNPNETAALILLREFLSANNITKDNLLRDSTSPQFQAMEWIANRDENTGTMEFLRMLQEDEGDAFNYDTEAENSIIQRYTLSTLYFATNGPYWTKQALFLSEEHECNWSDSLDPLLYFVKCKDSTLTVQEIHLSTINASGSLPDELGHLINLEKFSMSDNAIGSTIPTTLILLSKLEKFDANINKLTGNLPNLGNHTKLKTLSVSSNLLAGTISEQLSSLKSIEDLRLNNNQFVGTIPSYLGQFKEMSTFHGQSNKLSGTIPLEMYNISSLRSLNLRGNMLSGTLSEEIGRLTQLEELNLIGNRVSGTIPRSIKNIRNLFLLELADNNLGGKLADISEELGLLVDMKELNLNGNQFSGSIPEEIGNLKALTNLDLASNNLEGTIPRSFLNLIRMHYIDLSLNMITGNTSFLCERQEEHVNIGARERIEAGGKFAYFATDCKTLVVCSCCTSCF